MTWDARRWTRDWGWSYPLRAARGATTRERIILERETYRGVVTLGAHHPGRYYTAADGEVTKARRGAGKNPTRITDAHEPLIERETFDAVQAMRLKPPKPHWRNGQEGAPLAGLLYCGRCGNVMYAQSLQRKSGQKFPNYVCATYHKARGCGYCVVPQEAILTAVANTIREAVLKGSPERLERAVAAELARREKAADSNDRRQRTERELARLDNQIKRATQRLLIVDDSLVRDLERELLSLKDRQARLAAERVKPGDKRELSPKEIAAGVWKLDEILRTASPSKVRNTLSTIVERITLQFEPGRKNKRGQSFRLVEGRIEFCPIEWGHPGALWWVFVKKFLGERSRVGLLPEAHFPNAPGVAWPKTPSPVSAAGRYQGRQTVRLGRKPDRRLASAVATRGTVKVDRWRRGEQRTDGRLRPVVIRSRFRQ